MFLRIKRWLLAEWIRFTNPITMPDAFAVTVWALRFAGMYPYTADNGQFRMSKVDTAITLTHLTIYAYVNLSLFSTGDLQDYAKPLIVKTSLTVAVNIILKGLGVVITFVIYFPLFTGIRKAVQKLNGYNTLMMNLGELGIDTKQIFKQILVASATATLVVLAMCTFILGQAYYFYERLTDEKASTQFFYVVGLTNFYKNMCLYALMTYMSTSYMVLTLLNRFLQGVLDKQIEEYEARKMKAIM